ncbi:Run domain Beclin-1-interacting like protein [Argiope bruennichi]|uniref:Run domain Beclin-1-interacting like protein n=1 Tax=Argiope bruennichi TaxID=94029 RepID=A0A8T0E7V5_ARGBR|nr:Run domain Beclin-1-interacting like protein [Argiope bruennichi]
MPLNSSEGSTSVKCDTHPSKSPHYSRKKRLSSQKRSNALKDKLNLKQECVSSRNNDVSFKSSLYDHFVEFLPSVTVEKFSQSSGQADYSSNSQNLKRSLSFPMVYSKSHNKHILSKSFSLLDSNTKTSAVPFSNVHSQPEFSDNSVEFSNVKNDNISTNLFSSNSTTNVASGYSVSRRSSTSTICERHESIGSEFSQISIIDMKEIESLDVLYGHSNSSYKRKVHHSRSKSDVSISSVYLEDAGHPDVFSLPNSFSELTVPPKKSIFEGKQVVVPTECFFPRPRQGQSLTSFLSSNDFNISAELDRENAHFCISEALIAAIEHMKFSRMLKIVEDENDSDEEIRKLKQRIRIRKRERQREEQLKTFFLLSDGRTDTTTSQSASPPASSHSSDFEVESIGSEDEVEDLELSAKTDSNLSSMKENGLSLSKCNQLYSGKEWGVSQTSSSSSESLFRTCKTMHPLSGKRFYL